jgi:hypothetical protein
MESKWHQPWSEPVRFRILPALAIALAAASGNFFNPLPLPNSNPANIASTWFIPWQDPVRVKPRLHAALNEDEWLSEAPPFTETVTESRWHQPWSEPVRFKPDLGASRQLAYAAPNDVDITLLGPLAWYANWRDPVKVPLRLAPALNQFEPDNPFGMTQPETVSYDKWNYPWSEPVRLRPAPLLIADQRADWLVEFTFAETVSYDRWNYPWSEPVRFRPSPLLAADQRADWLGSPPLVEAVLESKWHQPWSEPKRFKLDLGASRQAFYFANTDSGEDLLEPTSWFNWFSEPVRLKPGLLVDDQPFVSFQVIEPMFPNYLLTVRNQIVRKLTVTGPAWTTTDEYPPEEEV